MYRALAAEASRGDESISSRSTSTPAGALQATISRYFDEGPRRSSGAVDNSHGSHGSSDGEVASVSVTSSTSGVTSSLSTSLPRLPHEPLDERACDALVRDASVLVSDPSFRGRVSFEDDGLDWKAGGGGGVGVGGGASGMAPHAWLLKVRKKGGCIASGVHASEKILIRFRCCHKITRALPVV